MVALTSEFSGTSDTDPLVAVQRRWGWVLALGMALIVVGGLACAGAYYGWKGRQLSQVKPDAERNSMPPETAAASTGPHPGLVVFVVWLLLIIVLVRVFPFAD